MIKTKWIVLLIIIAGIIIAPTIIHAVNVLEKDKQTMDRLNQQLNQHVRYTNVNGFVTTDNFTFELAYLTAKDRLEYNCPEANSTGGWEFLVMHYIINNTGNYSITVWPVLLRDKNGVAYFNLDSKCNPDEFGYPKEIPPRSLEGEDLIYKIPINVVLDYLNIDVGGITIIVQGFQKL